MRQRNLEPFRGLGFAYAGLEAGGSVHLQSPVKPDPVSAFPLRPDASVINGAIPLYYIGRTREGFWLAREAEGRSGGIFLFKRSAVRFANRMSAPVGCAKMHIAGPVELDVANQGSLLAAELTAAIRVSARRTPRLISLAAIGIAFGRTFLARVSRAVDGARRNRAAIEKELFQDQYKLSSKNDDDVPVL